jgi:hypothetical protein
VTENTVDVAAPVLVGNKVVVAATVLALVVGAFVEACEVVG